jgi:hypothetical protein
MVAAGARLAVVSVEVAHPVEAASAGGVLQAVEAVIPQHRIFREAAEAEVTPAAQATAVIVKSLIFIAGKSNAALRGGVIFGRCSS